MDARAEVQAASQPASLLKRALRGNAAFSVVSGAVLVVEAPFLAPVMGIPSPLALTVTGIVLLPFGLLLWWLAGREELARTVGWIAIELDVLWVAGSIALLLSGWLPLTTAGNWIIALVADAVAMFAVLQYLGVRRLATSS